MGQSLPALVPAPVFSAHHLREIAVAASVAKASYAMNAVYIDLLEQRIFSGSTKSSTGNKTTSHKRRLISPLAEDLLAIIWRESRFCPQEVLERLNIEQVFPFDGVVVWTLAQHLEPSSKGVTRVRQRIDCVVAAAEAYNLVERIPVGPSKKRVTATKQLHDFMVELAQQKLAILSELRPLLSERLAHSESNRPRSSVGELNV